MKYRTRIRYTETDKALMWERWRQGESLQRIAQLFDRNHSAIGGILSRTGGIRPSPRHRSALALKLSEREEVSRGVMAGRSMRTMARALGRAPSTVSREIGRNGGRQAYRASEADASAWQRARRPKRLNWHRTGPWHASWRRSCDCSGRPTRWPGGSSAGTRRTRRARCPTRPSTARCSSRPAEL